MTETRHPVTGHTYADEDGHPIGLRVVALVGRGNQLVDELRGGLRSFDTDAAGARWATVKTGLRLVLLLARLNLDRMEADE